MNRVASILIVTLAALLFSGCAAMMPKSTPEGASRVMQQAAQYKGSEKSLGSSEQNRKPIRDGQWVASLIKSKSDVNDVTLQIVKVVQASANGVTLEMEQYAAANDGKRYVIQQTIKNYPLNAKTAYSNDEAADVMKNVDVQDIKMMDENGEITSMPSLPMGIGRLGSDIMKTNVATGEITTDQCASGYYRASKCFLVPFEAKILWMSESGTTYAHSAVPILGFIKSESEDHAIEVIGFGDKGAKPLIR